MAEDSQIENPSCTKVGTRRVSEVATYSARWLALAERSTVFMSMEALLCNDTKADIAYGLAKLSINVEEKVLVKLQFSAPRWKPHLHVAQNWKCW